MPIKKRRIKLLSIDYYFLTHASFVIIHCNDTDFFYCFELWRAHIVRPFHVTAYNTRNGRRNASKVPKYCFLFFVVPWSLCVHTHIIFFVHFRKTTRVEIFLWTMGGNVPIFVNIVCGWMIWKISHFIKLTIAMAFKWCVANELLHFSWISNT